jgi:hypothetical protein
MVLAAIATKQQKVTMYLRRLRGGAPEGRHASLDPSHHDPSAAAGAPTGRPGAGVALPVPGDSAKCRRPSLGPRRAVSTADCSACLPPSNYGATVQPGAARHGGPRKRKGNLHSAVGSSFYVTNSGRLSRPAAGGHSATVRAEGS